MVMALSMPPRRKHDASQSTPRADHLFYSWDRLRPDQQQAAFDLLGTAWPAMARRRRRRALLVGLLIVASVVVAALALYVVVVAR
jgi:hypothetical protein